MDPVHRILWLVVVLLLWQCNGWEAMSAAQLITATQLALRLEERRKNVSNKNPTICVLEVGSPKDFQKNPDRIDGSHSVWRPDYDCPVTPSQPLTGLVPTREQFTQLAERLGVHPNSDVILVDRTPYDATRLWWLFVLFGKRPSSIWMLDGGYTAARKEPGIPWTPSGAQQHSEGEEPLDSTVNSGGTWKASPPNPQWLATVEDVRNLQNKTDTSLWDVRTMEEYKGRVTLRGAVRPGRIPWATKRVEWNLFRSDEDGSWLPPNEIVRIASEHLGEDPDRVHTFYCQSGVRTTQLIFGMALAGWSLDRLRNYDGSWVEWSRLSSEDIYCETEE